MDIASFKQMFPEIISCIIFYGKVFEVYKSDECK